ncbi:MAG: hypothetical protein GQ574_18210 [Crocinitomix sp.]|nr:hypothetical protein [Crocinitomix sp.]
MNNRFQLIISAICLLSFYSCKPNPEINSEIIIEKPVHYIDVIDTSLITIIPLTNAGWMTEADRQAKLSIADFQLIDLLIKAAVIAYNTNMKKEHEELLEFYREDAEFMGTAPPADFPMQDTIPDYSNYIRQYVPYYNVENEKVVAINFSCSAYGEWKTVLYQVNDGGNCYFDITLNLTTGQCERIMVNGYA